MSSFLDISKQLPLFVHVHAQGGSTGCQSILIEAAKVAFLPLTPWTSTGFKGHGHGFRSICSSMTCFKRKGVDFALGNN